MNTFEKDLKKHIKPFDRSEVRWYGLPYGLDFQDQIERAERMKGLALGIVELQKRREGCLEAINTTLGGVIPELRAKHINRIDTINRAIRRLTDAYTRL